MKKTEYLLLVFILLISLSFRLIIFKFIPINQINLLIILMGLANLLLVFSIIRKLKNTVIGLMGALIYAISPWTAYLEVTASPYIILLTFLLVIYFGIKLFSMSNKIALILMALVIMIYTYSFNQIAIFSNIGLINTVNSFRGEINQTNFSSVGKFFENRYTYFSKHLIFNIMKQFTPATYFTNQKLLLGFSFSPPIYLGFIIPFLFGFVQLLRSITKNKIPEVIIGFFLILPSILSKDSPDLSRLVLVSPVFFYAISSGLYQFILNFKKGVFRFLLLLTLLLVVMQFFVTLSDIVIREPVRLQKQSNE